MAKKNSFSQFDPATRVKVKEYKAQDEKPREQPVAEGTDYVSHDVRDHSNDMDEAGIPLFKHHESMSYDAAKEAEKVLKR